MDNIPSNSPSPAAGRRTGDAFRPNHRLRRNNNNHGGRGNSNNSPRPNRGNNGRRNNNGGGRGRINLDRMTLEHGRIQSLLDKFGFIYCADRPIEIFFHYSESNQPIHSLQVGQEVQFYVAPAQEIGGGRDSGGRDGGYSGSGNGKGGEKREKLSAYSVSTVEQGTVVWETEDEPGAVSRGRVERLIRWPSGNDRRDRGVNINAEGTIRIMLDGDDETEEEEEDQQQQQQQQQQQNTEEPNDQEVTGDQKVENRNDNGDMDGAVVAELTDSTKSKTAKQKDQKRGPLVRYAIDDYEGFHDRYIGLARNDLVEFYVFTEKRSGLKYARNIVMVQTEQERLEEEREKALIESGTLEQGVVSSLKTGYGFLRSNRRRDEVYFHYSHIQLPEGDEGKEFVLKEGQDMEFYVVTEEDGSGRSKTSARKARFLEKGSVQFRQILATGVTGKVMDCPTPADNSLSSPHGKKKYRQNRTKDFGKDGKVQLDKPIQFCPVENQESSSMMEIEINDVVLHPDDCPALERVERDGSHMSLWVREGDTLLFDVVRDVVDGKCRVVPTKSLKAAAEEDFATAKLDDEPKSTTEEEETVVTDEREAIAIDEKKIATTEDEKVTSEDQKEEDINEGISDGTTEGKEEVITNPIIPRVRIITLSTEIRAEGTIASIKDNFGFIRPADHSADVYFRLDEVFPPDLSDDLWRNRVATEGSNDKSGAKRILKVGARVIFDYTSQMPKNSSRMRCKDSVRAERIIIIESKKKVKKSGDNNCQGYVLMEPSHTSLSNTPSHIVYGNSNAGNKEGGRWDSCIKERNGKSDFINNSKEGGSILLLSDPSNVFENDRVSYINSATRSNPDKEPKRGDLICFMKGKGSKARDVRILKRNAAQTVKGNMSGINISDGTANFTSEDGKLYPISLSEVISCDIKVLKDNVGVEGILHNDGLVGICRTADLYLTSTIGSGMKQKQRPRLNLTVKNELKGLGGRIIAQSGMAKGPDGTTGFHAGWTTRISKFYVPGDIVETEEKDDNGNDSNQNESKSNEVDHDITTTIDNIDKEPLLVVEGKRQLSVESCEFFPKTESM